MNRATTLRRNTHKHDYNDNKTMCNKTLIGHGELHLTIKIKIMNR
jgi:hypothetical protein